MELPPHFQGGPGAASQVSAYRTGRAAIQGRTPGLHRGPAIMGSDPTRGRQCGHTGSSGRPGKNGETPSATHTQRCPAKGGAKSALKHYATDFYAKPEKAPAEQRNETSAPAGGIVGGGGSGRPAAPIFTPQATQNGARKKETWKRLTKSRVCGRLGNPPCRICALTHKGVRHYCGRGHHGHPKGVCIPCTPRHTPLRTRLASQRTPGTGGMPAPKRPVGRVPPCKCATHQPPAAG